MMDSNRIFVDTNVIIGAWAGSTDDDRCLKYLFSLKGKTLGELGRLHNRLPPESSRLACFPPLFHLF